MKETWKNIPGYEGLYQASDQGRIRSLDRYVNSKGKNNYTTIKKGCIKKFAVSKKGITTVQIQTKNIQKCLRVDLLVLKSFFDIDENEYFDVVHKDANYNNNCLNNLEFLYYENKPNEFWKKVLNNSNYEVSNLGRVRSLDRYIIYSNKITHFCRGRMLKQIVDKTNRYWVHIIEDKKNINRRVCNLVLESFVSPRPFGLICCHNDGNPLNNNINNLRWDTPKNNSADSMMHGTIARG